MPKMKTNKAVKSRFKVSGTGKLMRYRKGRRHILSKKSGAKKRHLAKPVALVEPVATKYARLIGA